jgi:co-chaperonin GroES (HSP10)
MKVLNNYILLKEEKGPEQKSSGLLLATTEKSRYKEAEVIESGSEFIKKGDRVMYDAVAGYDIRLEDKSYRVVKHSDIVIILS